MDVYTYARRVACACRHTNTHTHTCTHTNTHTPGLHLGGKGSICPPENRLVPLSHAIILSLIKDLTLVQNPVDMFTMIRP